MSLYPRRERLPLWGGELLGLWGSMRISRGDRRARDSAQGPAEHGALFSAHLSLPTPTLWPDQSSLWRFL